MDNERTNPFDFSRVFPLKATGRDKDGFRELVVEIVRRHMPELKDDAVTT